jgi:outer membrane protein
MNWIVSPATYWNMNPVKINKQLLSINCVKRKVNINQMKNSLLILPLLSGLFAQGYNLEDCIKIALDGKKTLLSAELNVTSAERGVTGSYSGLLPSLNATTGVGRTQFPERESVSYDNLSVDTTVSSYYDNMSAGISLNQTIFDGGRSWNQVKQAKTNLNIAQLNYRSTTIQVIQNVIKSYYELLKAQKLYNVAEKNLEMSVQQVSLVTQQYDLGVVKKTDLLKAEVAKGQASVDVLIRNTNLQNARRVLFNDMGMQDYGQSIFAVDQEWIPPEIPSSGEALKLLKTKNPTLLVSQSRIKLGELSYKIAKGLRLPSLRSSVSYSANGEDSDALMESIKDDWSLGMNLSVSVPIYTGKSLSTQQYQAKLSKQQSEYDFITLLNDFRVQAALIRESLKNYSEIIPLNRAIVISAEEDLKLVLERYSLGSATILEVLDAQVSLTRSNSTLINTIHEARMQEAGLKALLGTLDLEYQLEEN